MNRPFACLSLIAGTLVFAAFVTSRSAAQDLDVRDLTGTELTEEALVEILKPIGEAPEPVRARGISVAPVRPRCGLYRTQMTRGVAVRPTGPAAAIQISFAFNSADLRPEATRNLDVLGRALASDRLAHSCFRIEGHTDDVGSDSYNNRLSRLRAEAVVRYLNANFGLGSERLLSVGYGEREPIASNDSEGGRGKNRRVQIVNLGYGETGQ